MATPHDPEEKIPAHSTNKKIRYGNSRLELKLRLGYMI